ncbi:MAG: glycosyltransferase [Candidatus Krumholzibacteria bacterium]|nr:glycosyltransferase [Candidatus Krumholzibacteria bacterium]MDH4338029.1 glycosyltransferase [Candidatus Krumholzibacteria bacterium]MDH5269380.1 glycosyltransferase [Candidatus Krumholzibacteria bacterium]
MIDIIGILEAIERNFVYLAALSFFAWYPLVSSGVLVLVSMLYYTRRERSSKKIRPFLDAEYTPSASVVIAAFNESEHIQATLDGILAIDYPDFEVIVIDDGSSDGTTARILPYVRDGRVRLVRKLGNEGKAMALNDGLRCASGEIILIMDADAIPDPGILRFVTPHFKQPRVGAVTGNPRVFNRDTLLAKLQAIEFTAIISLQRRAQRVWGRILTMSGVVGAFHRSALFDAGLYSPDMATEDIDLSWKLQLRSWEIRYEPRAVVWMRVPSTMRGLWRQRLRWARGLAQVLRRHGASAMTWRRRRLWPLVIESWLSITWAYCFVVLTSLWIFCYAIGYPPVGASPIPNWWGMLIGTMCLIQLLTGVLLDRRYDRRIPFYYFTAVFYPLMYWIIMAIVTSIATPGAMLGMRKAEPVRWKPVRGE